MNKPNHQIAKSPNHQIGITAPLGFAAGGATCGLKASGKPDLAIILAAHPCSTAGMFTRNKMPGAPVIVGKRHLRATTGRAQAIVCNSGCSNVCTGQRGIGDAEEMCRLTAAHVTRSLQELGTDTKATAVKAPAAVINPKLVLPCSTGVIGKYLPMDKLRSGIADLAPCLGRGPAFDRAAATAIMTTDLVPKSAVRRLKIAGRSVTLAGIAKGSGMIQPNLATMFCFITTDAAITPAALQKALRAAVTVSFNRLSVDHDTSTSDSVIALASGLAGHRAITGITGQDGAAFAAALTDLCKDLAYQIVKDGEGATKVYRVRVIGARSQRDADRVGYTVTGSPLIKCAVHGGDPNWGRLVAAVGRSGAAVKPERLTIHIGPVCVGRHGFALAQSPAAQRRLNALMQAKEITFTIDLGLGSAATEWLGCDLSKEYVSINADYTT